MRKENLFSIAPPDGSKKPAFSCRFFALGNTRCIFVRLRGF
ncbi:hypothetical protein BCO26_2829 [Heyndrickxia coagulans 2-6]|nr:hypothetical protein BCO26_2829 [Heyndrickxia coagulans 2-6]